MNHAATKSRFVKWNDRTFKILALASVATVCLAAPSHAGVVTGDIAVYQGNTLLGYVSKAYDGQDSFTYSANMADALSVSIDTSTTLFAVQGTNSSSPAYPYLGAVGGSGGYNFSSSDPGYAYLAGTGLSPAGSVPSFSAGNSIQVLGYNAPSESTIWSATGNDLIAEWVNVGGTTVDPVTVFYDPVVQYLGLTDDLGGYNATYGDGASAVTFVFTGTFTTSSVPEPSSLALFGTVLAAGALLRRRGSSAYAAES